MSYSWWCHGSFGPLDNEVNDFTYCFQTTCIALPVPVLFCVFGIGYYCCWKRRSRPHGLSYYQNLMEFGEDIGDTEGSDISSTLQEGIANLCTSGSRALWLALAVMVMFPFAEILIRFVLGEIQGDKSIYPWVDCICEGLMRAVAFGFSAWIILASSFITSMVRIFWALELLLAVKEIESSLIRSIDQGKMETMIVIHCLRVVFNSVLGVYAWRPLLVGEDDQLSMHQSVDTVTQQTYAADARKRASTTTWNDFMHGDKKQVHEPFIPSPRSLGSPQSALARKSPRSGASRDSTRTRGSPDLSDAAVRIISYLVRKLRGKSGEEVDFAIQVSVSHDVARQLGSQSTSYVVYRNWSRFRMLHRQIRSIAADRRMICPEFPHSRSLESDRGELQVYLNTLLTNHRFWKEIAAFLHADLPTNTFTLKARRIRSNSENRKNDDSFKGSAFLTTGSISKDTTYDTKPRSFGERRLGASTETGSIRRGSKNIRKISDSASFGSIGATSLVERRADAKTHLSEPLRRFFADLYHVAVLQWTKWKEDSKIFLKFTIKVSTRSGESYEVHRRGREFQKLRSALAGHVQRARDKEPPVLPNTSAEQSDVKLDEVRKRIEAFIQEVSNAPVFHCTALQIFLTEEDKATSSKATNPHTPASSPPINETSNLALPSIGTLEKTTLPIETSRGRGGTVLYQSTNRQSGIARALTDNKAVSISKPELKDIAVEFCKAFVTSWAEGKEKVKYRRFTGPEGVDFMLKKKIALTRQDAVVLGNRLMKEESLFDHVNQSHAFFDDPKLLYSIRKQILPPKGVPTGKSKLGGSETPLTVGTPTKTENKKKAVTSVSVKIGQSQRIDTERSVRFEVKILGYSKGDPIMYPIVVREYYNISGYIEHTIWRRYSEFVSLRKALVSAYGNNNVPGLPPKMIMKNDSSLQKRSSGLEVFLKRVVNTELFQKHDQLLVFLKDRATNQSVTIGNEVAPTSVLPRNAGVINSN
mmetsp:Transcript_18761/g.28103  ORF Transcript_18761/g.28103 Transcript_18761/m.28103 type:complete len:985 (+) Transcript_18761:183-3137(+)